MSKMSATERKMLDEKLTAITDGHVPELDQTLMEQCEYKLINHEKDTANLTLVTKESSDATLAFMYKVFGDDPFLGE